MRSILLKIIIVFTLLILNSCVVLTVNKETEDFKPFKISIGSIKIDGMLNESEWINATRIDEFLELYSNNKPHNKTEAFILYDSSYLYVAFKVFVKDTSDLNHTPYLKDDERIAGGDWVAICLDTYGDGLNAIFFMSNPNGEQIDGNLNVDGSPSMAYSTMWQSAASVSDHNYTVEMAIPFRELPFDVQKINVQMSFKLVRFDASTGIEYDFPKFDRNNSSHLTQFKKINFKEIERNRVTSKTGIDMTELINFKVSRADLFDVQTLDGRCIAWGDASLIDYKIFKDRKLKESSNPFVFEYDLKEEKVSAIFKSLEIAPLNQVKDFDHFLERTLTTSFIVIKDDKILFERYYNGYSADSFVTSFSIAKSIVSILVGMAIDDGYITSELEPITRWIPELLKKDMRFEKITIRDLLTMSSGLRYEEEGEYRDDEITYYHPDLRHAALVETEINEAPASHFYYNNYNPLLLGLILERSVGKPVTEYMQEKLWEPIGMQYNGSWSTDDQGFEKMESGINARSIDFAKIGRLMLNQGNWQGHQLISKDWVDSSTQKFEVNSSYYPPGWYFNGGGYYSFFWWGIGRNGGKDDFFGMGNKGQYLYICPQKNLIIIRNGISYGIPSMQWPSIFYEFANNLND